MHKILIIGICFLFCSCFELSFSERNKTELEYLQRKIDEGEFEEASYFIENVNNDVNLKAYNDTVFVAFYKNYLKVVMKEVNSIDEFESPELLDLKEYYYQMYLRSSLDHEHMLQIFDIDKPL